jgi:hypothetical protein
MPGNVRAMTTAPELDETDKAVLVALLRQVIATDPVPLSARVNRLPAILGKLESPVAQPPLSTSGPTHRGRSGQ